MGMSLTISINMIGWQSTVMSNEFYALFTGPPKVTHGCRMMRSRGLLAEYGLVSTQVGQNGFTDFKVDDLFRT